jgi:rhamnogalacturonyl hydrolase YesR
VSCETALSHHGLIPDVAQEVVAVCTSRTAEWHNALGRFRFRHLTRRAWGGYRAERVAGGQEAYVATPEKALLDLVHETPRGDAAESLDGLRLQNLDRLDLGRLVSLADGTGSPKLQRAAARVAAAAREQAREYEDA